MKRAIQPTYTFAPGSGTLNLSGIAGFDIRNLFSVINLKTGSLLYAPLAGYSASSVTGTTLTLQVSMAGLAATDPLMIIYDDGGRPAEDGSVQSVVTAVNNVLAKLPSSPALDATVAAITTLLTARLPTLASGRTPVDGSGVTQPVSGTVNVGNFPGTQPVSGTVTANIGTAGGLMTEATGQAIKTALLAQADVAETLWVDAVSGTFYMRRVLDTAGTISIAWTDTTGAAASPTVANLRPLASDNALALSTTFYDVTATAGDTGTAVGDVLNRVIIINKAVSPPVVAGALWINATTGAAIAAPTAGNIAEATRSIKISAQSAGLALDGTDVTAAVMPTGGGGIRGWLSALHVALTTRLPAALVSGRLSVDGSGVTQPVSGSVSVGNFPATQPVSGTVSVSNLLATQPISATALPLPSGAALDTTVAGVTTAIGTDGTSPPALPGGATGVRGWLRYIGSLLAGTLVTSQAVGAATEASAVALSLTGLNLLSTVVAGSRLGWWFAQNQSAGNLVVALDDGAGNNVSVFPLTPAPVAGQVGGSMGSADTGPHTGRIRIYGPAASQHALRVQ